MDGIEEDILGMKEKQKVEYETLQAESVLLSADMVFYEEHFATWEKEVVTPRKQLKKCTASVEMGNAAASSSETLIRDLHAVNLASHSNTVEEKIDLLNGENMPEKLVAEVRNLEATMQMEGGVTGGWNHEDHDIFLKFYLNHKEDVCITRCLSALSDQTHDTIVQHIEWYKRHVSYVDHKKMLLKEWKLVKEVCFMNYFSFLLRKYGWRGFLKS